MSGVSPAGALPMAVAVVSFETADVLEPCLASVALAGPAETVVVDNASTDTSAELVRERFPDVLLIVNDRNRGYGAAANQAVAASRAPVVLLLNSDIELEPGAVESLGRYLGEHPEVAIAGPRLANTDGTLQPSTFPFPSISDMLLGETGLHLLLRRVPWLRERFLRTWDHERPRAVPWLRGAALAIRRSAFEAVGGFDEDFFMYWEEVDLCRRLRAIGLETHYAPVTTIVHARAVSTSRHARAMRREWLVGFRRYLMRHEPPRTAAAMLMMLRALTWVRTLRDRVVLLVMGDVRRPQLRERVDTARTLLAERKLWAL